MSEIGFFNRATYNRDSIPEEMGWIFLGEPVPRAELPVAPFAGDDEALSDLQPAEERDLEELPDAFEASFGPFGDLDRLADLEENLGALETPMNVIEATAAGLDTTQYPQRTIAHLRIHTASESWGGTAFLIGPRTLLTAGHNVFLHFHGGWPDSIEVIPGRNGRMNPHGTYTSTSFATVNGWRLSRDSNFDYGAIFLSNSIGSALGHLGVALTSDSALRGASIALSGYPDRTDGVPVSGRGSVVDYNSLRIYYRVDTGTGHSGSPVGMVGGGPRAVAVHAYSHQSWKSGIRIRRAMQDRIREWALVS